MTAAINNTASSHDRQFLKKPSSSLLDRAVVELAIKAQRRGSTAVPSSASGIPAAMKNHLFTMGNAQTTNIG
jgi:hypothetical protein